MPVTRLIIINFTPSELGGRLRLVPRAGSSAGALCTQTAEGLGAERSGAVELGGLVLNLGRLTEPVARRTRSRLTSASGSSRRQRSDRVEPYDSSAKTT